VNRRVPAFVVVGLGGFVVQIAVLAWLTRAWAWPYGMATALAVESAVLHNFAWHERWTWRDRRSGSTLVSRLLRFHAGTAITSIVGNVLMTVAAVEFLGVHPLIANAIAVVTVAAANFTLADRWVFARGTAQVALLVLTLPGVASAASPGRETLAAWNAHVAAVEQDLRRHDQDVPLREPDGRTIAVPDGTIHEWRGSITVRGISVAALVDALSNPGLPPPSDDVLEARVLNRRDDNLSVYLKLTRTAVVTVTYDTEHDVAFERRSRSFATSRSVATRIRETGGGDRGFLWKLNSYWRYRQVGDDVQIDVLSLSLSRSVPAIARPIASPLINRIARESLVRTLEAMRRFAEGVGTAHLAAR
jgi:putative flippase GtrA